MKKKFFSWILVFAMVASCFSVGNAFARGIENEEVFDVQEETKTNILQETETLEEINTSETENLPEVEFDGGVGTKVDPYLISNEKQIQTSGTCGEDLTWTLSEEGELVITGNGYMYDYDFFKSPWEISAVKTVKIENGVTKIGNSAFKGCSNLSSIELPSSVTWISSSAFYGCSNLSSIELPSGVTDIGDYTFYGCSSLSSIKIPSGVTEIRTSAFYGCSSLNSIELPSSVTWISSFAFYDCSSLSSIELPSGVIAIGRSAFSNCSSLSSIELPSGVTNIDESTFYGCSSLSSIKIPSGVTWIRDSAFWRCSSLRDVYYSGTEAEWKKISIGWSNDVLSSATIHYNSMGSDDSDIFEYGCVRYFSSWDAEKQTAYWGESDYIGSKVTDATDTSFLESLDSLLNQYVLVETKSRDDGMVDSDYLMSIKPVESKKGTVSSADATSIMIDGNTYATPEWMKEVPNVYVDKQVLYHIVDGQIVDIEALSAERGILKKWNAESQKLTILPDDLNTKETDYTLGALADETTVRLLSILESNTHIRYVIDNNKFVYQINKITDGNETETKTIKYWDKLEMMEKFATIQWGRMLFENDSRNIDISNTNQYKNLVKVSALLSSCVYDLSEDGYLDQMLEQLGSSSVKKNPGGEKYEPGYSISFQRFNDNNIEQDVIIVAIRGTDNKADALTDIDGITEDSDYPKKHPGFSMASNNIKKDLETYISTNQINTSTTKILITGHSYGGAVANLLAKDIEDAFEGGNIFAYTFGAPNNIVVEGNGGVITGNNIHNFRNAWDPVTMVPFAPAFGEVYTLYGQQHYFQVEDIGENAEILFWVNHCNTHYVNYALDMPEDSTLIRLPIRHIRIRCPIDVEAYDENGNIVGRIINNKVDESVTKIMMFAVDDEKNIFIPADGSVKLSLTATDTGTMNFDVYDYDVVSGDVSAVKTFNNVALESGKLFSSNITDDLATSNVQLEVVDKDGNKLATVNEDGSETPETSTEIKGDLNCDGKVSIADVQMIFAYISGGRDLTEEQLKAVDINGDSKVTMQDAQKMFYYVNGRIEEI